MKKIFFFLLFAPIVMQSCSSDDENGDEFYQRQVASSELEAGTGTYSQTYGTTTYYFTFGNGRCTSMRYKDGKFLPGIHFYDKYEVKGDSLYLTDTPDEIEQALGYETKYYTLYINFVHWSSSKEQLQIMGGNNPPPSFQEGYYDKDIVDLR